MNKKRTIFLTGATGLMGSYLLKIPSLRMATEFFAWQEARKIKVLKNE